MSYLTIVRGDDETLDILVTDQDTGDPVDLASAELTWMTKRRRNDVDADALIVKTIGAGITVTNEPGGAAEVVITSADTDAIVPGAYWWELQSVDATNRVATLAGGRIVILPDLIRTT